MAVVSSRSRALQSAQVLVAIAALAAGALFATWLAERKAFRARFDVTASKENTLDPATLRVVETLASDVAIDVFFTPLEPPVTEIGANAQARVLRLLRLVREHGGGRLTVEEHDVSDVARLSPRAVERKNELELLAIAPGGALVVSRGTRREVLRLRGDLADLDPGQPDPRRGPYAPPRVVRFRAEEALVNALLSVTRTDAPKIVFTSGHGERDPEGNGERDIGRLREELERAGFTTATWDATKGRLPADAAIVASIGAEQPFAASEFAELRAWVERGGRFIAAPGFTDVEGDASLAKLLDAFGVRVRPGGIVARPAVAVDGTEVTGVPDCAEIIVAGDGLAKHPVTEALRAANRRVVVVYSRALERGEPPPGARVLEVLRSPDGSWLDVQAPGRPGSFDWTPGPGEERRRHSLAMESIFSPRQIGPPSPEAAGTRPEVRVLVVGASDAFANALFARNRDFLVALFERAVAREHRVQLSTQSRDARRLDLSDASALSRVNWIAFVILPGLCLVLGAFTAWKRARA